MHNYTTVSGEASPGAPEGLKSGGGKILKRALERQRRETS